jgi:hypothetical protein
MISTPYSITSVDKDDLNNEPSTSEICKGKTPRTNRYKTEIWTGARENIGHQSLNIFKLMPTYHSQ